jgi:hypothetical protein
MFLLGPTSLPPIQMSSISKCRSRQGEIGSGRHANIDPHDDLAVVLLHQ